MNRLMFVLGIIGMMIFQDSQAQTSQNLSLKTAVDNSLKNSSQIKLGNAKILQSQAALKEAKERRLPDFNVSGAYMRLNQPNVDLKIKFGDPNEPSQGNNEVKVNQMMYGMANVSWPIFAGFKFDHSIQASKYLQQAAVLDNADTKEEVIQNSVVAYSNLYKTYNIIALVKENLRQAEQRVADFTSMEKNGLIARNDLLKAQLQVSNVQLSLLEAENDFALANFNMNVLMGTTEATVWTPDSTEWAKLNAANSIGDWENEGIKNRKDLSALTLRQKAMEENIKITKGDLYPSVALTGGYIAAYVPNVLTVVNALNAGIGVKYSLSSLWKTDSKIEQTRAQIDQLHANEQALTDQIKVQINQSKSAYILQLQKIDVLKKAIEQAEENYRIVNNKYKNSLVTTTDLLDADIAVLQSKENLTNAYADALVAYNQLLYQAGIIDSAYSDK